MTDKLVTHEDLPLLRSLRDHLIPEMDYERAFLDRLITAAEADQPPLPEGWVVHTGQKGDQTVFWHLNGHLYVFRAETPSQDYARPVGDWRDRLTPLRLTVTPEDVETVAYAIFREHAKIDTPFDGIAREVSLSAAQAALHALDVEVSDDH